MVHKSMHQQVKKLLKLFSINNKLKTIFKHCNATCTSCGKGYVHKWDNPRNNTNKATSLSNYYCYNCCKLFRKNRLLLAQNNNNKPHIKQIPSTIIQSPRQLVISTPLTSQTS
jgi:hypothetical protein